MTIKRLVGLLADLSPHAYSDSVVLMWLSQCENSILTDMFLIDPAETVEYGAVTEDKLLVPHPYDKLYLPYLQAQVAHANQEYELYANLMVLYNAYRYEYAQYIVQGVDPGSGDAVARGYYLSAYGIAIAHGFQGTEEEWLESLKGAPGVAGAAGADGAPGENGKSAYQSALDNGFEGTEQEWLESLQGEDGAPGKSAYQSALDNGFVGTEGEFIDSLKGPAGRVKVQAMAAADGIAYAATVEGLGISSGTEIVLVPQQTNQGEPTLSINGGNAYPLCLRPGWNVDGNDLRPVLQLPMQERMLLRGAEYVFRFAGGAWILQSHILAKPTEGNGTAEGLTAPIAPTDIEGISWLNWFDYENHISNYQAGKIINTTTGAITDYAGYYVFPKIPLEGGKTYTMSGSMSRCVLYNAEDDSFIAAISTSAAQKAVTFTIDAAYPKAYIRFCHNNTYYIKDQFMIVEGDTLPKSFVPHKASVDWLSIADKAVDGTQLVDGSVDGSKLRDGSVAGQKLKEGCISSTKLAAYSGAMNLYNWAQADESLWHSVNGTVQSSLPSYFASPLIPVEPGETYYIYYMAGSGVAYPPHNAYEVSAEGVYTLLTLAAEETSGKAITYTAGENAAYVAFNGAKDYIGAFAVTKRFLPYIPPHAARMDGIQSAVQGYYAGGLLVALGDSITRGCSNGETLEDGTVLAAGGQIPKPYGVYAAQLLGMACKNFGVDGATVATVIARINDTAYLAGLQYRPEIITVKVGTNDMAQVALGTIDDAYDAGKLTYYGGLKEIARLLSEGYPESTIVFITPLRAHSNAASFVKAMQEVAELYDIPCMPMHRVLRYMQQNAEGSYYINDHYNGLHPNQAAHYRMGRALAGFLQTV